MKNIFAFSLSLIILFSFVAPSFASIEVSNETSTQQEVNEYAYSFNELEIISNTILTEQEIENLYNEL